MLTKEIISPPFEEPSAASASLRASVLSSNGLRPGFADISRPRAAPEGRYRLRTLESQIAEIWEEMLSVEGIAPDSNFFDLGGQSALAVGMLVRVERTLGCRVDVTTLFKYPTLRGFAQAVSGETTAVDDASTQLEGLAVAPAAIPGADRVVEIQRGGDKTPVLVLNNSAVLFPLARALGKERPLYALQLCPSTKPIELPARDFRDLAHDVVDLIRVVRPHGPYILMGLCVFGSLAFEAAQQLRDAGETVELVVLNDSRAPGHLETMPEHRRRTRARIKRARILSREVRSVARGEARLSELLSGLRIMRKLGLVAAGERLGLLDPDYAETLRRSENRWYSEYLSDARRSYRPREYAGDLLVFRCEDTLTGRYFDPDMGWRSLARGRLQVMECPGLHAAMYQPAGSQAMARGMRIMLGDV